MVDVMTSIRCDIAILPTEGLARRATVMSAELQKFDALFQLSTTGLFPHASLYMVQLKVEDLDRIRAILATIAASAPQFDLTATRYSQAKGYIDIEYARTEDLDKLQMTIIDAISPIRDDMREKDSARVTAATGRVRENLEKYGYRAAGELFRPHMTFTRLADGNTIDTSSLSDVSEFSGQFVKLGLFETGDNGTCVRKIAEFNLGGEHN